MSLPSISQSGRRPVRIVLGAASRSHLNALVKYLEEDAELVVVDRWLAYPQLLRGLRRTSPDLIAVELDLLGATATETAQRIEQARPVRVVVLATAADQSSDRARAALAAGAIAVVSESAIDLDAPATASAHSFRCQFRRFAITTTPGAPANGQRTVASLIRPPGTTVIGICASTGGPPALESALGRLPADFPIPILVVQHMMRGFTEGLVSWLAGQVAPAVGVARKGQDLEPGVWFASDDAHLVLDPCHRLASDEGPAVRGHRPSGDRLLSSLAEVAGAGATGVVLTGMGRDGAAGLVAIKNSGGLTIAQDEASCAVYGMPRVAAELGAAQVLSPVAIGDELARLAEGLRR
jgi:two-component system chemotaxis response regulator CheB